MNLKEENMQKPIPVYDNVKLSELRRIELRLFVGLITGCCPLRYHLKKMGHEENALSKGRKYIASHPSECDVITNKKGSGTQENRRRLNKFWHY